MTETVTYSMCGLLLAERFRYHSTNKKRAQDQKQTKLSQEPIRLIVVICQCLKCVVGRFGEL